jgi:hypothetical protein
MRLLCNAYLQTLVRKVNCSSTAVGNHSHFHRSVLGPGVQGIQFRNDGFNPTVLKICAWSGVIFCFMWLIGAGPVTGWVYLPPPSAADLAEKTVGDYASHLLAIRIGCTITIFSTMFYTAWGMAVSFLSKKVEGDYPILFYIQLVSLAVAVVVILYISYFWAAASFRAGDTLPQVTQALNDMGWLGVLYTGAPFAIYMVALATVTLTDKSEKPVYPRWSAYLNLFVAFFMFEAAGILFFKTGPFSQNGVFVFYIPMFVFFSWILVFSWLALRAISAEVAARASASDRDPVNESTSVTPVAGQARQRKLAASR